MWLFFSLLLVLVAESTAQITNQNSEFLYILLYSLWMAWYNAYEFRLKIIGIKLSLPFPAPDFITDSPCTLDNASTDCAAIPFSICAVTANTGVYQCACDEPNGYSYVAPNCGESSAFFASGSAHLSSWLFPCSEEQHSGRDLPGHRQQSMRR